MRTGTNHYSLAFTYDCIAWSKGSWGTWRCAVGDPDEPFWDPILSNPF